MKKVLIVIPAYNEEEVLEKNIKKLYLFCKNNLRKYDWMIVVSDNASEDQTSKIVDKLEKKLSKIKVYHMSEKSRSKSIKNIWLSEQADIYAYMDADLSTDIKHLLELISLIDQGFDLSTGSRTSKDSITSRSFKRNFMSIILISLLRITFKIKLSDFQCGFKAISRRVRDEIVPQLRSLEYGFIDTEMIVLCNKKNYKIKEIPVYWNDTRKSKASIPKSSLDAIKNIFRIKRDLIINRYKI